MDFSVIYTILIICVLLAAMSFASAVEMAFASLNKARIKSMAENGDKRAALVLKLHGRFDELITTMLFCGYGLYFPAATMATFLFMRYMGDGGAVASGIVMTLLAVVLTDDFPKSMAKQAPEKFALRVAPIAWPIVIIFKPVTFIMVKVKQLVNERLFSKKQMDTGASFRGEELLYVVEEAEQEGTITEEDSARISKAIELTDLQVEDILTCRVSIAGVPLTASMAEVRSVFLESGYSRLPVFDGSIDNIVGVVHIKNFLKCASEDAQTLDKIMSPAVYTANVTRVPELLKLLQKEKRHMVIVTDEHGGTEGIVTMDDISIKLLGEIWDESDEQIEEFVSLGDGKYRVLCSADRSKAFEFFGIEGESESITVGGWITDILERIPAEGDTFTYKNLTITVTKASPTRVEECLIEADEQRVGS